LWTWAHKDQLLDAMLARLDELSGDGRGALDPQERVARDGKLALECLEVERQIEAAVEAGETTGVEIKRADDASPIAVLGLHSELYL
jgi:hypothetical protein